ncbi:hypothetical protein [Umezawaea sp. Da 62-37]|uniref:hypothetical protein n=1 Tax=Umezawaea sp. Da 62-37 TaxID=3075927 RepID=UPI0028F74C43|nr:hypothetical protein [Umezawaea sp. Da 62-37]WNV83136.1 hypothetical protein RM788_33785 [Umezawaea sp. Da 62-37]
MNYRTVRFLTDIIMTVAAVAAAAVSAAAATAVFALIEIHVDGWEAFAVAIFYVLILDDVRTD